MQLSTISNQPNAALGATTAADQHALHSTWKSLLQRAFGVSFNFFDGATGAMLDAAEGMPQGYSFAWGELCRETARRGRPEFIADDEPLLTLAIPLTDNNGNTAVAVATFLTRAVEKSKDLRDAARATGVEAEALFAWAVEQTTWNADALQRTGDLVQANVQANNRIESLRREANSLSMNLASTYEEISLLYRLTQNLKLSQSDVDLGRAALGWMQEVVSAQAVAIQLLPVPNAGKSTDHAARREATLLTSGNCSLNAAEFSQLTSHLDIQSLHRPIVINRTTTEQPTWPFSGVRQLVLVALAEGENLFGWLAALNHVEDAEFGTVEASLLSSVAAILGIHSGNIELYRQQSELLEGVVRALTSAIDAKDPYTCGHSDRVARITVRLAEEMGCEPRTFNTLYLAGLLHDVGKIGIDDSVLRKQARLTEDEYEHIKQHTQIGYRILQDLSKLENVLPIVLHHHESWDGSGYPQKLDLDHIPLGARIVAVADAFDAMSSDRPYRNCMPDERVDSILQAGAGQQWDPAVIEAYFRCRDDIRRLCRDGRAVVGTGMPQLG